MTKLDELMYTYNISNIDKNTLLNALDALSKSSTNASRLHKELTTLDNLEAKFPDDITSIEELELKLFEFFGYAKMHIPAAYNKLNVDLNLCMDKLPQDYNPQKVSGLLLNIYLEHTKEFIDSLTKLFSGDVFEWVYFKDSQKPEAIDLNKFKDLNKKQVVLPKVPYVPN